MQREENLSTTNHSPGLIPVQLPHSFQPALKPAERSTGHGICSTQVRGANQAQDTTKTRTKQWFWCSYHIHSWSTRPLSRYSSGSQLWEESFKDALPGWSEHLRQVSCTPALILRSSLDIHFRSQSGPVYWTRWIFSATQHCCLISSSAFGEDAGKTPKAETLQLFFHTWPFLWKF